MPLDIAIEGVLFYKAQAVTKRDLCKLFSVEPEALEHGLTALAQRLEQGGTRLVVTTTHAQLVTDPALDEIIESLRKDELRRDIGKAGAETLAIILYKEPVSRAEIDRIRGVNSGYILRNLQIRGLIERQTTPRGNVYSITPELLNHLGVTNKIDLPDYALVLDKLESFEQAEQTES